MELICVFANTRLSLYILYLFLYFSYEPELFPGLVYRMIKPRLVLLIFVNGKIVFTGAKSRQDIKDALYNIYPILKSFRKN